MAARDSQHSTSCASCHAFLLEPLVDIGLRLSLGVQDDDLGLTWQNEDLGHLYPQRRPRTHLQVFIEKQRGCCRPKVHRAFIDAAVCCPIFVVLFLKYTRSYRALSIVPLLVAMD